MAIFGIFGGGAGYRGQNRTQREKSYLEMLVKMFRVFFFPKTKQCLTSQVRCADMPPAGRKVHFFMFLTKNYQMLTQNDQKDPK